MQCHFVIYQQLSNCDLGLCLTLLATHDTDRWNRGYPLDCQSVASHCKRDRKLFSMKSATHDRTYFRRTYHQDSRDDFQTPFDVDH